MKFLTALSITISLLFVHVLGAQDTIHFDRGLVIKTTGRGDRSAVYYDQLYYQIVNQTFQSPNEGDTMDAGKSLGKQRWETLAKNEDGIFQSEKTRGGYLFLTYKSPGNPVDQNFRMARYFENTRFRLRGL
ncbi:MAG: hypothetical protein AAFX53_07660, partial [Bacteroidota bacterium]